MECAPVEIEIGNGRLFCIGGEILTTNKEAVNQEDLHYFRENIRSIPEGEKVEVIKCWCNFGGYKVRCRYNGNEYDIKPSDLDL